MFTGELFADNYTTIAEFIPGATTKYNLSLVQKNARHLVDCNKLLFFRGEDKIVSHYHEDIPEFIDDEEEMYNEDPRETSDITKTTISFEIAPSETDTVAEITITQFCETNCLRNGRQNVISSWTIQVNDCVQNKQYQYTSGFLNRYDVNVDFYHMTWKFVQQIYPQFKDFTPVWKHCDIGDHPITHIYDIKLYGL
jgi:hypothetical protein